MSLVPLDSTRNLNTDTQFEVSMREIKKNIDIIFCNKHSYLLNILTQWNANQWLHCTLICDCDFVSTEIFVTLSQKSAKITSNIPTKGSGIVFDCLFFY